MSDNAKERYWSYRRGWIDGAAGKAWRREFIEHPTRPDLTAEYRRGYADGHETKCRVMQDAANRLGHTPSILRVCDDTDATLSQESFSRSQ